MAWRVELAWSYSNGSIDLVLLRRANVLIPKCLIALLTLISFHATAQAEEPKPLPYPSGKPTTPFVMLPEQKPPFAVAGNKCPPASFPYNGPENKLALSAGFIYCQFSSQAVVVPKRYATNGACPNNMTAVTDTSGKPDDVVWCQRPSAQPVIAK